MSTITDNTAAGATNAVGRYARSVREHLNDLEPEILDELTGGLEADLTDSLADRMPPEDLARLTPAEVARRFGDPGAYAAEMRDAAGIAPPEPRHARRHGLGSAIRAASAKVTSRWRELVQRHGPLRAAAPVVHDLRPVWWVLRGWILYQLAGAVLGEYFRPFPERPLMVVLLAAFLFLSVQWGRSAFGQGRRGRAVGLLASALAFAIALPIVVATRDAADRIVEDAYWSGRHDASFEAGSTSGQSTGTLDGVYADGEPARNLFVYGPDGQPIEGAQIVDQDGHAVILPPDGGGDWEDWDGETGTPSSGVPLAALEDGAPLNVFPYSTIAPSQLALEADGSWTWDESEVRQPQWPAPSLFPVHDGATSSEGATEAQPGADVEPDGNSTEDAPLDAGSASEEPSAD